MFVHRLSFYGNPNFWVARVSMAISRFQGPGQGVVDFLNMHVIHVHMPIFQWESEFCGYKVDKGHIKGSGEQRERQPQGPGQGVVHFFSNIHMIYVYMPIFQWKSEF